MQKTRLVVLLLVTLISCTQEQKRAEEAGEHFIRLVAAHEYQEAYDLLAHPDQAAIDRDSFYVLMHELEDMASVAGPQRYVSGIARAGDDESYAFHAVIEHPAYDLVWRTMGRRRSVGADQWKSEIDSLAGIGRLPMRIDTLEVCRVIFSGNQASISLDLPIRRLYAEELDRLTNELYTSFRVEAVEISRLSIPGLDDLGLEGLLNVSALVTNSSPFPASAIYFDVRFNDKVYSERYGTISLSEEIPAQSSVWVSASSVSSSGDALAREMRRLGLRSLDPDSVEVLNVRPYFENQVSLRVMREEASAAATGFDLASLQNVGYIAAAGTALLTPEMEMRK